MSKKRKPVTKQEATKAINAAAYMLGRQSYGIDTAKLKAIIQTLRVFVSNADIPAKSPIVVSSAAGAGGWGHPSYLKVEGVDMHEALNILERGVSQEPAGIDLAGGLPEKRSWLRSTWLKLFSSDGPR